MFHISCLLFELIWFDIMNIGEIHVFLIGFSLTKFMWFEWWTLLISFLLFVFVVIVVVIMRAFVYMCVCVREKERERESELVACIVLLFCGHSISSHKNSVMNGTIMQFDIFIRLFHLNHPRIKNTHTHKNTKLKILHTVSERANDTHTTHYTAVHRWVIIFFSVQNNNNCNGNIKKTNFLKYIVWWKF